MIYYLKMSENTKVWSLDRLMQLDDLGRDSSNLNDLYKLTAAGTGIFVKDVRTLPCTNL